MKIAGIKITVVFGCIKNWAGFFPNLINVVQKYFFFCRKQSVKCSSASIFFERIAIGFSDLVIVIPPKVSQNFINVALVVKLLFYHFNHSTIFLQMAQV